MLRTSAMRAAVLKPPAIYGISDSTATYTISLRQSAAGRYPAAPSVPLFRGQLSNTGTVAPSPAILGEAVSPLGALIWG